MSEQVEGKVEFESAKAFLVIPTIGPDKIWIPKSQIDAQTEPDADKNVKFDVTDWWYNQCYLKAWERGDL
jgi:hypothetical protein